jgi:hypothetical protein
MQDNRKETFWALMLIALFTLGSIMALLHLLT